MENSNGKHLWTYLWTRRAYRDHPAQQPEPFQAAQKAQGHCPSAAGMLSLGHPPSPQGGCSRSEHPLSMEMLPNIHSDPPLAQL